MLLVPVQAHAVHFPLAGIGLTLVAVVIVSLTNILYPPSTCPRSDPACMEAEHDVSSAQQKQWFHASSVLRSFSTSSCGADRKVVGAGKASLLLV